MGKEKGMKLEELLGADLYAQVKSKLDEVNANEPDKLKHVRYADLSEGEYGGKVVGKKYGTYDIEPQCKANLTFDLSYSTMSM